MTKVELIAAVANEANLTKKDAEAAVNSALNAITNALKEGDKVALVGFGIEASKQRAFKAGKALKDSVQYVMVRSAPPRSCGGAVLYRKENIYASG